MAGATPAAGSRSLRPRPPWVTERQATPFHRSADGQALLFGRPWEQVPRGLLDVLGCLVRRHQRVMWDFYRGRYEERCSCGARRGGLGERWTGGQATRRSPPTTGRAGAR